MKKLFIIFTILSSICAHAQKFGIRAGLNIADIEGGDFEIGLDSRKGYHVGVFYSKPLSEKVMIEPGVALSTKGAQFRLSEDVDFGQGIDYSIRYRIKWISQYLDFPVMFKYYAEPKFYVSAIPTISFLLDNQFSMTEMECVNGQCTGSTEEENSTDGFRTMDLGFGFGVGYDIAKNLSLSASYTLGAVTMDETSESKAFNRVAAFSVAFQF